MLPYCRCQLGTCVCLMTITDHIFAQMELSIEIGTVLCQVYAWLIWFKEKQLNHANFAHVLFMLLLFIVSAVSCFVFYVCECECACESGGLLESPWSNGKKYNAYSIIHQSDFLNSIFLFIILLTLCIQFIYLYCRWLFTVFDWVVGRSVGWFCCLFSYLFGFLRALPSFSFTFSITTVWHISRYTNLRANKYCLHACENFCTSLPAPCLFAPNRWLKFIARVSHSIFICVC